MTTTTTRDIPILFSTPMIQAILARTKTQTRRIVKPQPELCSGCQSCEFRCDHFREPLKQKWSVGDRLFVRETWSIQDSAYGSETLYFKADNPDSKQTFEGVFHWKPSIHLKKGYCRLWLEVINVRVERLQDISEEDAITEGIEQTNFCNGFKYYRDYLNGGGDLKPIESFRSLWESINGADSWGLNPYVWVIEFRRVDNAN